MLIVDQSQGRRQLHGFWKIHYLSSIFGLAVISHTNLRSNSTSQSWKSLIGFFLVCLPSIFQASFPNTPNTFNIMSWGVGWEQAGPYWILFPVDWNAKKDAKREMDAGGAFLWLLNQGLGKYPIFGGYWELGIKDWENFPFLGGGELGFA